MKILEVIPLLSVDGGAESFVVYFCNELIKQGHKCAILTLYGVPQEVISKINLLPQVELFTANKGKGLDVGCSFKVLNTIREYRPDAVHVHVGAIPYITVSSVLYTKCKYFATIHSEAKREAGSGYAKWSRLFLFKLGRVKPVTISEQSTLSFVDLYKIHPIMIYNGVPAYQFSMQRRESSMISFIHVARCHPVKNQLLLLSAFKTITDKYDNVELNWYGDNSECPELFDTLRQFFNDHIRYCGSISDARYAMCEADAFCLTSKMEGMPMTIIEAMSVGCVPIVTPVGGCVNMIKNGSNGLLSDNLSVESYVNVLESYIKMSENSKKEIRERTYKSYVESFSIENTVNKYLSVFAE